MTRRFPLIGALISAMTLPACMSIAEQHQNAATRNLAKFARDHPDCQIWTDWETMCSRTGPGREPSCVKDRDRPAEGSSPFCVARKQDGRISFDLPQTASADRYCDRVTTNAVSAKDSGNRETADSEKAVRSICESFKIDRPFDGRRLTARRHSWCKTWSDISTGRPVCTEDSKPATSDMPMSCDAASKEATFFSDGLYCSEWGTIPNWCSQPDDSAYGFPAGNGEGPSVTIGGGLFEIAVIGIYCHEERS